MNFRPIRPTSSQKAMAMALVADHVTEDAREAARRAEHNWATSPEGQAALTADSLRALGLADKAKFAKLEAQQERRAFLSDPDYQTRDEQRRISDVHAFMLAGNATFTIVSKATGTRFTYRVRQPDADKPHFVSVLTGSDNESSYTFLGTIFPDGTYRHGKRSSIGENAPSAKAFSWLYASLGSPSFESQCDVWHEGRCCRCGRKLTVPSSIEAGIGPECAGKE